MDFNKIYNPKMKVIFTKCKLQKFRTISLYNGTMFINGKAVATLYENGIYYWHRKDRCNNIERGTLRLINNGLSGEGIVEYSNVKYPFICVGANNYLIKYSDPEGVLKSFEFKMGINIDEQNNLLTYGEVYTANREMDKLINDTKPVSFVLIDNKLNVMINIKPLLCSHGIVEFKEAKFEFDSSYEVIAGKVITYDKSNSCYLGVECELKGELVDANKAIIKKKYNMFRRNKGIGRMEGNVKNQLPYLITIKDEISLSVNDLFTLDTPNAYDVQDKTMTTLFNLMLYSIDDTLRGYFGQAKPVVGTDLTQADVDLLVNEDIKNFLSNFAKAYLCKAYSGSGDEKVKNAIYQAVNLDKKMQYFWSGNGKTSLSSNAGYNLASSEIMKRYYGVLTPGLGKYYNDNPKEWAEKLYNYCLTDTVLTGLAIQKLSGGTSRINHLCSVLHFLNPDPIVKLDVTNEIVPYSIALFYKVLDNQLNTVVIDTSTDNIDKYKEFLDVFFPQYLSEIFNDGGALFDAETRQEALEDINNFMTENNISSREELTIMMSSMAALFTQFISYKNLNPLTKNMPASEALSEFFLSNNIKYSTYIKLGFGIAMYATGIVASIECLVKWDELTTEARVLAVASVVQNVIGIFSNVVLISAIKIISSGQATLVDLIVQEARLAGEGIGGTVTEAAIASMEVQSKEIAAEVLRVQSAVEKWTLISRIASTTANVINIIVIGLVAVSVGFTIYNDIKSKQPIAVTLLDILQEVVLAISIFTIIASMVGILTTAAPWLLGIVIVAGIIISIVSLFIKRKDPISPIEKFITNTLVPFVNELESPSDDWIKEREEIDVNLDNNNLGILIAI